MADYDELNALAKKAGSLASIQEHLGWDQQVMMPPGKVEIRGEQMAALGAAAHAAFTDPRIGELLERLEGADIDEEQRALVREVRWDYDRATKVPSSLIEERARVTTKAHEVWTEARKTDDFSLFAPYLERIVDISKRYAAAIDPSKPVYEVLVQDYEPCLSIDEIRAHLYTIRDELAPFIKEVLAKPAPDTSILEKKVVDATQLSSMRTMLKDIGFDFKVGRFDESVHPFTADYNITTRLTAGWKGAILGTIHEMGHWFYEYNLPREHFLSPLGQSRSLSIHESQSHIWDEQIAGREAFWSWLYPKLKADYGFDLSQEEFFKAINGAKASLIRVEADELTYAMHVILRFEIEEALMSDRLEVKDIPRAWNEKMQELLGITPPDDTMGCLQDVHWSGGAIGYFPTYTMGSMIAAQLYDAMHQAIPDLEDRFAQGDFAPAIGWLKENVHKHGRRYSTQEIVKLATGEDPNPRAYIAHLKQKYSRLYGL